MSEPQISLQQWRALVAVVGEGSVHLGAKRIGRSHSAVSQAISKMELLLGAELLVPDGRGVKATAFGEAIAKRAARVLRVAGEVEAFAETRRLGWESGLRVAVDAATPNPLVTGALAQWGPQARGTSVALVRVIAEGAVAATRDDGFDLVLSAALADGVTPQPIADIPFKLVLHRTHPLAEAITRGDEVDLETILASPQLVVGANLPDEGDGWRAGITRWTVPDFEWALAALATGIPFALVPADRAVAGFASGELVEVVASGLDSTRQLHLLQPRGARTGPAAQVLAACFQRAARSCLVPGRFEEPAPLAP